MRDLVWWWRLVVTESICSWRLRKVLRASLCTWRFSWEDLLHCQMLKQGRTCCLWKHGLLNFFVLLKALCNMSCRCHGESWSNYDTVCHFSFTQIQKGSSGGSARLGWVKFIRSLRRCHHLSKQLVLHWWHFPAGSLFILFIGKRLVSYTQVSETSAGCLRSIYPSLGMRQLFGDVTMGQWRHN